MKAIASRSKYWCVIPAEIQKLNTVIDSTRETTTIEIKTVNAYDLCTSVNVALPNGQTWEQFLEAYQQEQGNIYLID